MDEVASDLLQIATAAETSFGQLTAEQLNWKPGPGRWSVAQCFDHLIVIQTGYFPILHQLAEGRYSPTPWERYSPFSGMFGRMLIRALEPNNTNKTKTAVMSEPSLEFLGADIIKRFVQHQTELVHHLKKLPAELTTRDVIITSPLSKLVTYSLSDCLTILVVHGQRHFRQAERVVSDHNFPATGAA